MKITIYKFIYDTDSGTGCDLSTDYDTALEQLHSCAVSWGYEGPPDAEAIAEWKSGRTEDIDTYFIDSEEIEVPTAQEVADSIIADIQNRPELAACKTFSELHDHCDANVLGDSEALLDKLPHEAAIALLNQAQEIVNKWLCGRINPTASRALAEPDAMLELLRLTKRGIECFYDDMKRDYLENGHSESEIEDMIDMRELKELIAPLEDVVMGREKDATEQWHVTNPHPQYPVDDWQYEVADLNTHLGYNAWVESRVANED